MYMVNLGKLECQQNPHVKIKFINILVVVWQKYNYMESGQIGSMYKGCCEGILPNPLDLCTLVST